MGCAGISPSVTPTPLGCCLTIASSWSRRTSSSFATISPMSDTHLPAKALCLATGAQARAAPIAG